jgi:hypothetical protein
MDRAIQSFAKYCRTILKVSGPRVASLKVIMIGHGDVSSYSSILKKRQQMTVLTIDV